MAMSMQQTKSRIRSVNSTSKITKAMELVSTSKLKKAKDLHFKITPFKQEVFEIISYVVKDIADLNYRYFCENQADKDLYIVVTSSLGLCGGYNINMEKYVASKVNKEKDDLMVIGNKGIHYFKNQGYHVIKTYPELPKLDIKENLSSYIARSVLHSFDEKKYRRIRILSTKFINSLTFEPTETILLPLSNLAQVEPMKKELLLEPSPEEVLDQMIPFYLTTAIKALLLESMLSEQASRRTAMENATDNAQELQEKLLLEFNKSRQAAITQEITEISGAANAQN